MSKDCLTWDELANEFDRRTGGRARTKRMESIFEWAERQTDVFVLNDDGSLRMKESA